MNIRVILVCGEGVERQAYLSAIEALGVQIDTVSSLEELHKAVLRTPYHGVMIDLKTKIRAAKVEKILIHDILEKVFPVIQLKLENKTSRIQTLYFGQAKGDGTLEDFILKECRSVEPRSIRLSLRKNINFNIILSKNDNYSKDNIEKSVTIDVSEGGCFIYSSDKWEINSKAWFIIKELDDNTPILSEVRWKMSWGNAMKIPGIGVKFKDIREGQLEEIYHKF
jgi:Tfp pilus assembly protein PilZ